MERAYFANIFGETFSKVFKTGQEMEDFIYRAAKVGTRLLGFVSI